MSVELHKHVYEQYQWLCEGDKSLEIMKQKSRLRSTMGKWSPAITSVIVTVTSANINTQHLLAEIATFQFSKLICFYSQL